MGIGVNAELAPELDPAAQPAPVEIEPPGIAIDLDCDTVLGAGAQHALDIQVITRGDAAAAGRSCEIIERAVRKDIGLDPLEDAEPAKFESISLQR
jgi:hypothetical protein